MAKIHTEISETGPVTEGVDIQTYSLSINRDRSEEGKIPEKDSELERTEETEFVNKDTEDRETADEGLPPSNGSGDESEEGSGGEKEPSDANNSLETLKHDQDEFIDIPESSGQVSCANTKESHVVTFTSLHKECCYKVSYV